MHVYVYEYVGRRVYEYVARRVYKYVAEWLSGFYVDEYVSGSVDG